MALGGAAQAPANDTRLAEALAGLGSAQGRLRKLDDDYYVRGVLPESRLPAVEGEAGARDRVRGVIDVATTQRVVLHTDPRSYWASADVAQRRELIRLIVAGVTIRPAKRGVPRFDSTRVDIELLPALWAGGLAPVMG